MLALARIMCAYKLDSLLDHATTGKACCFCVVSIFLMYADIRNFLWNFNQKPTENKRDKEPREIKKARKGKQVFLYLHLYWYLYSCYIKRDPVKTCISSDPCDMNLLLNSRLGEETSFIEYIGALFLVAGTVINKVDQSNTEEAMETEDQLSERAKKWVSRKIWRWCHPDSGTLSYGSLDDSKSCLRRTYCK